MLVEDVLKLIADRLNKHYAVEQRFYGVLDDDWHASFIQSVNAHAERGRPLSTEQSKIVLKIITKVRTYLISYGDITSDTVDGLLASPNHRQPLYQSTNIPKEVRHIGSNLLGFRFKYNELIISDIKALSALSISQAAYFEGTMRIWVVAVTRASLQPIKSLIKKYRFGVDCSTENWFHLLQYSLDKESSVFVDEETDLIVVNVCDNELLAHWVSHVAGGEPI